LRHVARVGRVINLYKIWSLDGVEGANLGDGHRRSDGTNMIP